ncbi:MAG: hypothetical protein SOU49_00255 [Sodaliphilus pleomorphus]|uniref:hypothetical protein n=1 Tax=Sodaliphilus pleomorphus TaxID=2606626 RepID=UPI002A7554C2|nr:hypothetical protein [Sodaliphilus pleomorphus]MDY2831163.1 hypothetical protein [Sodaliphilus pleomorphus]
MSKFKRRAFDFALRSTCSNVGSRLNYAASRQFQNSKGEFLILHCARLAVMLAHALITLRLGNVKIQKAGF